jgi:hypothetical protein
VVEQRGHGRRVQTVRSGGSGRLGGAVRAGEGVGHRHGPQLPGGVGVRDRPQVAEQVRGAPGVHRREVVVAGVAVADQDAGEVGQDPALVDVFLGAAADVHHRQISGAGDVHVGQGLVGAAGGLVGVQHRRGGQECLHVRGETAQEFVVGAAAGAAGEPGGQVQPGQRFQQRCRLTDGQVVPAGQQYTHRQRGRPDPHRRTRRSEDIGVGVTVVVQSATVTVSQQGHRLDCNWYSVITGAAAGQVHHLSTIAGRTGCLGQRVVAAAAGRRFDRDDAIRTVGQGSGHSGVTGLLAWLAARALPRRPLLRRLLTPRCVGRRGAGGVRGVGAQLPFQFRDPLALLGDGGFQFGSDGPVPGQMAPVSGTRHQAGTGAELRHRRNSRRARAGWFRQLGQVFLTVAGRNRSPRSSPRAAHTSAVMTRRPWYPSTRVIFIATAWRTGELDVIGQGGAAVNPSSGRARRRACWPSAPGHRRAARGRRVGPPCATQPLTPSGPPSR